jgi:hypothetical protein
MEKIWIFVIVGSVMAIPLVLAMSSGSTVEPTGNDYYYRGGKTIKRQSNKHLRKKTLRYKK